MKLRCPYCKNILSEPKSLCPECGRAMVIPSHLRKRTVRQRKESLSRIYREAEAQERELAMKSWPRFAVGRSAGGVMAMVVVMVIVGALLVTRTTQTLTPSVQDKPSALARREIKALRIAVERFKRDIGHYPTASEGGLTALIYDTGHWEWRRPYVTMIRPDPWGKHYQYEAGTNGMTLFSCGPDGVPNTADDIVPEVPTEDELKLNPEGLLPGRFR